MNIAGSEKFKIFCMYKKKKIKRIARGYQAIG